MNTIPDQLPARPLRNWFLAWHLHTGDPPKVIAKGFDLDGELVAELLGDEAPLMLRFDEAMDVCHRLRIDPRTRWTSGLAPPWETERLDAVVENLVGLLDRSPLAR